MRRAFLMASNGPIELGALQFALLDAERIADCLAGPTCGFQVERVPSGTNHWQARQQLVEAAAACTNDDVFVCYFSGHGVNEKGNLYLLWDGTKSDRLWSTSIPVSDVLEALRHCQAHSKLLILDCCHAGAVVQMKGLKDTAGISVKEVGINPDNFVVLMASDRLERAREFEQLQGSFLTTSLCKALTKDISEADKDDDNRVSIEDLRQYLQDEAIQHNQKRPDLQVPRPYIFGQLRGDFFLTLGESDWLPYEFEGEDGSIFVVIPVVRDDGRVLCVGKHPIINSQWRKMGLPEPIGETFTKESGWVGPFYPWREERFNGSDLPVVCISLDQARAYCESVTAGTSSLGLIQSVRLFHPPEWDYVAFGTIYPGTHPNTWLSRSSTIHHKTNAPAPIDRNGIRANVWGISDMIGNVWEWCDGDEIRTSKHYGVSISSFGRGQSISNDSYYGLHNAELRGGSFLDDLTSISPFVSVRELKHREKTKHSDMGFRVIAEAIIEELPKEVETRLALLGKPYESVFGDYRNEITSVSQGGPVNGVYIEDQGRIDDER